MIAPNRVVFTTEPHRSVVDAFVSSVAKKGPGGAEGVGRAVNQAVVIAFLGIFAFNYVFTQTLLATHPEISVIK